MDYRRVAELHDPRRRDGGTGYLIQSNLVLTAHHVIALVGETATLGTPYDLRFIGDFEAGRTEWRLEGCHLCWDKPEHDLALLKLEGDAPAFLRPEQSITRFGKLGGETLDAKGWGFPLVQTIEDRQNPEPLEGRLSWLAGLKEHQLRLQVTSPVPARPDEWAGISGTALFVEDCLVGVIIETNKSFAEKALWAVPITLVADDDEFRRLVLGDPAVPLLLIDLPRKDGIHRAIIAGRPVIANIINTGDHNQFFIGSYEHLRDAYIDPWPVFERVALEHFEGREWLLAKVDAFLCGHDRGYFILEAEAGLGKTTFLAWLVRERGYIHHFTELTPGLEGVEDGLKNLAAQLVRAYELNTPEAKEMLPSVAARPEYLRKLLKQASDQRREGEKIVLVVDALDESAAPLNQNVLGLPQVLPEGVFFIVSQRPVAVTLDVASPESRDHLRFTADSADNQADMCRFLERAATWPGIAKTLQKNGYSTAQFVTTLLNKCQGIWIYLHYVVHEIEGQKDSQFNLEDLPAGMTQYYARHWKRWRDADDVQWYGAYLPLLSTLAAAQVPLTVERLAEWANVTMPEPILRRLLNERWRPFLTVAGQGVQTRYRFYHASLQEFFDGRIRRDKLTVAEEAFVEELALATRASHYRLAERYLTAWGGLQAGLPRLAETVQRELDNGYGLRYIAAHLEGAGRAEDLHCLLVLETNEQRNVWYKAKHVNGDVAGYLADVTRAWRLADVNATAPDGHGMQAALLCQYALITASLRSLTKVVPAHLLVAAVEQGRWSIERAMAHARFPAEPVERAAAMIALIPLVKQRTPWLDDTLETLDQTDVVDRKDLVARLAAVAAEAELLMILRHITSWVRGARSPHEKNWTAPLVHYVLARIPASLATEALQIIDGTSGRPLRMYDLLRMYVLLPEPQRSQRIREVLEEAHELGGEMGVATYASFVGRLAEHLGRDAVEGLLDEALAEVRELDPDSVLRREALIALLPYLVAGEQHVVLEELIARALDKDQRLFARLARCAPSSLHARLRQSLETQELAWIAEAAPHFTSEHSEALIERVLSEIERRENASSLLWMDQAELITAMNERQLERARMVINSCLDGRSKVTALTAVARTTSPKNRDHAIADLLAAIEDLGDIDDRARAFHELAPLLAGRYLDDALAAAERIGEPSGREHLAKMLPYLSDSVPSGAENTVRELIDRDLPHDHVRTHLARLIVPAQLMDSISLRKAMVHELPTLSVKNELRPSTAAALALRMAALGDPETAFELLSLGQNDAVTTMALVELATHLPKEQVLVVEERVQSVHLDYLWIPQGIGETGLSREDARDYFRARLAPSLARIGEIERAQKYVRKVGEQWQPAAWLGIAAATSGSVRTSALLDALALVLNLRDVFRRDHLDNVAHAIAKESAIAEPAWRTAVEWARAHPRHEAIEVLATFAPVVAAIGGAALVGDVYSAIERILRWWP